MQSILKSCQPHAEILAGTFNPEIFTASLNRVVADYRNGAAREGASSIYSDPVAFFRQATHPTTGLRSIVDNALARLVQGDLSRPAMQRLDTAFGGGKTHTLIALLHAAMQGRPLAEAMSSIVSPERLGEPGAIRVVTIIGDTVDTIREGLGGAEAKPNTLWWLLADQLLDETSRAPIRSRLESVSAPASGEFFDQLFGSQPTLIIIDEIAQYLARMEADSPGVGAEQATAFLMALSTYARERGTLSIAISLASSTNAFGDYNRLIRTLQERHGISKQEAEAMTETANQQMRDVVGRVAEATTPVTEGDLSHIMAKRLFTSVDPAAATAAAAAFVQMYRHTGTGLPAGASNPALQDELVAHYPFHPTLIAYLSQKLSLVEAFQGTRGLLRTLARTVRSIWHAGIDLPLIQTGHIDLSDNTIRAELLGRTGNDDFQAVLDADVSKVAGSTATTRTVAGELDARNPHPDNLPVHEWAWRVVFLHSLIGRGGGLSDEHYGINLNAAVFEMASPAVPPAAVRSALEQIEREANYLRAHGALLYANTVPTLNNILRRIQESVGSDEALARVEQVVRGLVTSSATFDVHANIAGSEDIPDQAGKLQLGVLAFDLDKLEPGPFFEQRGPHPREHQNRVLLLASGNTHIDGTTWSEQRTQRARRAHDNILALARRAIAVERLQANPENWGVKADHLRAADFRKQAADRPADLRTAVDESYRQLIFCSRQHGQVVVRDLGKGSTGPTGGGSGGLHLEDAIINQLATDGELITEERASTTEAAALLARLFFQQRQQCSVDQVLANFSRRRDWPMLQAPALLSTMLVHGAARGAWCLAFLEQANAPKPDRFYHAEQPPPLDADPTENGGQGWILCTREHAKKLGWLENIIRNPNTVGQWLQDVVGTRDQLPVTALASAVEQAHDKVDPQVLQQQLTSLLQQGSIVAYPAQAFDAEGNADPRQAITGSNVPFGGLKDEVLVPRGVAQARGWLQATPVQSRVFTLSQPERIVQLFNMLSGTALQHSKTQVQGLQVEAAVADGGSFQLGMANTTVGQLVAGRQLFSALASQLKFTDPRHRVLVTLGEVAPDCQFLPRVEQLHDKS